MHGWTKYRNNDSRLSVEPQHRGHDRLKRRIDFSERQRIERHRSPNDWSGMEQQPSGRRDFQRRQHGPTNVDSVSGGVGPVSTQMEALP